MPDKRFWPNVIYALVLFTVCVTLWQAKNRSQRPSTAAVYNLYTSNSSGYSYPISTLPADDYHQLIDLHNFTFTMLSLPCNDSHPLLLILVHSNPRNFETRRIVRETWGQNTHQVRVLFMTGLVRNSTLKEKIERENEEFSDLIQGSFVDAYRNLTYKHVMVFKYAIYHCPQAKYILKTDDDVFVNMPLMRNFLTLDLSPFGGSKMIFCSLRRRSMVLRSWRSKWRVSFKEYPGKVYPPYCPGWAILYSPDVVFDLYQQAQVTDYFWIDDVHITGTLIHKINLRHVDIDNLVLGKTAMRYALKYPTYFNQSFLYGAPNVENEDIRTLWAYVKKHESHVSVLGKIT